MPDAAKLETLLTAREAAAVLRVSERTVWALAKQGKLAAVRIGRAVRYRREDIQAFVEKCIKGE